VRSVTAWGGPLLLRRDRGARRGRSRPLPLGLHSGPRHLPEGGRERAPPDALI